MLLWHRLVVFERHLAIEAGDMTMAQAMIFEDTRMMLLYVVDDTTLSHGISVSPVRWMQLLDASRLLAGRVGRNVPGSSVPPGRRFSC